MHVEQHLERVAGLEQQLHAGGGFFVAFQVVATAVEGVVDVVVALLVQHRHARGHGVAERTGDRAFGVDGVVRAVAQTAVAAEVFFRTRGLELEHAGRRVAAEQRALRTAGHFDLVQIEQREALEDRVFLDHAVVHQRDRLGGVDVEVGVAEAADVETRERAAERGFDVQAGQTAGEQADVVAAGGQHFEFLAVDGGDGHRHVLDVLHPALRGNGDGVQLGGVRCGGGILGLGHGRKREQDGDGKGAEAQAVAV